jgi:hypothetical protein
MSDNKIIGLTTEQQGWQQNNRSDNKAKSDNKTTRVTTK